MIYMMYDVARRAEELDGTQALYIHRVEARAADVTVLYSVPHMPWPTGYYYSLSYCRE